MFTHKYYLTHTILYAQSPPNFLRAASMADYVKPVVVHNQFPGDDDTESQVEAGEGYPMVC